MTRKCSSCRKEVTPFKVIGHEPDATNRYKHRRKSVVWCQSCWENHERACAEDRAKAAEEMKAWKRV